MSKFRTSLELFERSFRVIRENKKLLLFPVIVSVCVIVIALFFLAPAVLLRSGHALTDAAHWKAVAGYWVNLETVNSSTQHVQIKPAGYLLLAGLYLVSMFVSTFFNVAFFNEILHALDGRPVSIRGGLRFAVSRLKAIFVWSLFAGIIGLLIKTLEERVGILGRWIVRLIGLAWSVASVFAIPVIVREGYGANPLRYLKSSASILRKTWGEALIGYAGVAFGGFLILIGSGVLIGLSIALAVTFHNGWLFAAGLLVWFVFMVVFNYVLNVVNQVYRGALYIYATEGVVPGPFDEDQMNMAWKVKSGRKR